MSETPYDQVSTCPYCGGSQYEDEGRLTCEDCGESTSPTPDAETLSSYRRSYQREFGLILDWDAYCQKIR